ncbi:MAG: hypothetical protein HQL46_07420 [Gammaproteobacteria bacterium]|nr:hypothetical protein [Gammaproteobacteria bacterium]
MPKCNDCRTELEDQFLQDGLCSFCYVKSKQQNNASRGLVEMKIYVHPELISQVSQYVDDLNNQFETVKK